MSRPRKDLRPEDITIIQDSREQRPLDLRPLRVEVGTITTGDYSVKGLQHCIALERKSLNDLLGCIGTDRERFEREIQRLLAYETRALVIESTWEELESGHWSSRVTSAAAVGSVLGWAERGLPVILAGNRGRAAKMVGNLLFIAARRRWRLLSTFDAGLRLVSVPTETLASQAAESPSGAEASPGAPQTPA